MTLEEFNEKIVFISSIKEVDLNRQDIMYVYTCQNKEEADKDGFLNLNSHYIVVYMLPFESRERRNKIIKDMFLRENNDDNWHAPAGFRKGL